MTQRKRALVIIDMQNDFVAENAPLECQGGREIIPRVELAICRARGKGMPVIHVIQKHRADGTDFGLELERSKRHCVEGTFGQKIVDGISVLPGDYLIIKKRFSSFFETELRSLLQGLGVEELLLAGVATDGCIRATAVDAHQMGIYFKLLEGCTAGALYGSHADSVAYLCRLQKDVLLPVEEL